MATTTSSTQPAATRASLLRNSDLILAGGVALIMGMLVIPIPDLLLDLFITTNFTLALLILLVSVSVTEPLEFSVFPSLLLFATLFRLAINVSSGRLILLNGHAGNVIAAFGSFVVGGNYVVGFVIFIVLVVIQFVVITNGAGRVAEVAARFTLDAMPGKQMAIDADVNAGVINDEEARRRRRNVQREADFYGAMDGASKFVKGDAIAGIVLIVVNLVGGLAIGILQRHLAIGQAIQTYALLTVGDGLVAQIPALLIATASGIVVTRSGSQAQLGDDLLHQLFSQPRVVAIVAGLVALLGLAPGLPKLPFFFLASLLGALAYLSRPKPPPPTSALAPTRPAPAEKENLTALLKIDPIELQLGFGLVALADPNAVRNVAIQPAGVSNSADLLQRVTGVRRQLATELGIVLPTIRVRDNLQLPANTYSVEIRGVEVARAEVYLDRYLALGPNEGAGSVRGIATKDPAFGLPAVWIAAADRQAAELRGYTIVDPSSVIVTHLTEVLRTYGPELLSRQDVQTLLDGVKADNPALVNELVPELLKLGEIQRVLQNLLREHVPIRNLLVILEALADQARTTRDPALLAEGVRQALGRTIVGGLLDDEGRLAVLALAPRWHQQLVGSLQVSERGTMLALEPGVTQTFLQDLAKAVDRSGMGGNRVLLVPSRLRLPIRRLVERHLPTLSVVAFEEVPPQVVVQTVGVVGG
jgi:flagellar biosynthesis protein FlhA